MGYFARNIPDEAFQRLGEFTDLKSIAFTPGEGWVILHGTNGYYARNIPDEALQRLGQFAKAGDLTSVAFTPGGGWVVLAVTSSPPKPQLAPFNLVAGPARQPAEAPGRLAK